MKGRKDGFVDGYAVIGNDTTFKRQGVGKNSVRVGGSLP